MTTMVHILLGIQNMKLITNVNYAINSRQYYKVGNLQKYLKRKKR